MGLLSDEAVPKAGGGQGDRFIAIYRQMDAEDQARIRRWDADPLFPTTEIHDRVSKHYTVGYSSVWRGLQRLRAAQWEC